MKRFYCTVCKRVKRVRKFPSSIVQSFASNPTDRVGQCERHSLSFQANQRNIRMNKGGR